MSGPPIVLLGEAQGAEEERLAHPFVGASGRELAQMCVNAGILPKPSRRPWEPEELRRFWRDHTDKVYLTNVFNLRPTPSNDIANLCGKKASVRHRFAPLSAGKYVLDKYLSEVDRLREELLDIRPNVVIALGGTATWALLNYGGISRIRGTVAGSVSNSPLGIEGLKVLPTYHPAAVLRDWTNHPIATLDLMKAKAEAAFPEIRRPDRRVFIPETVEDLWAFHDEHIREASALSFDIETSGRQITCIGLAPSETVSLVVPFVDNGNSSGSYWTDHASECRAWDFVQHVLNSPIPKCGQNGLYDLHFLWRWYGIPVRNYADDTMLLSHAMQPESPKGLAFLGSLHTNEPAWKLQRAKNNETIKREA